MRLNRGTPVHRINHEARINHANRSGSQRRSQMTTTPGAMQTSVTLASPVTDDLGMAIRIARDLHDREGFLVRAD